MIARSWPPHALLLPEWQLHRGYWRGGLPQNTIAAFAAAVEQGARMVECDVRLSRDQVPMLCHDPRPRQRPERRLRELAALELEHLGVDRLERALTSLPGLAFNLEIKGDEPDRGPVVARVAELIRRVGATERVLLSSFNPLCVRDALRLLPGVPVALLVADRPIYNQYLFMAWLRPHLLHLPTRLATRRRIRALQLCGFRLGVWTVNDRARARELRDWGVDTIISDELGWGSSRAPKGR